MDGSKAESKKKKHTSVSRGSAGGRSAPPIAIPPLDYAIPNFSSPVVSEPPFLPSGFPIAGAPYAPEYFPVIPPSPVIPQHLSSQVYTENLNYNVIYVKNIPPTANRKEILDLFKKHGFIVSMFMPFEENEDERKDILLSDNRQTHSRKGRTSSEKSYLGSEERGKNTSLKQDSSLESFNGDSSKEIIQHRSSTASSTPATCEGIQKRLKGYAFITFRNHWEAQAAIDAPEGYEIQGATLYVGWARNRYLPKLSIDQYGNPILPEATKYQESNLYISNLDPRVDDEALQRFFEPYGKIISAKVMTDAETGKSREFGFVCFQTHEETENALFQTNDALLFGRKIQVSFAYRRNRKSKDKSTEVAYPQTVVSPNAATETQFSPLYGPSQYTPLGLVPCYFPWSPVYYPETENQTNEDE